MGNLVVYYARNDTRRTVREILEHTHTDGFIVIRNNKIVYERYFNNMLASTLHLFQSVAKSVTATVCGILIHRNLIDRDAPLDEIILELAVCGYADATLRQIRICAVACDSEKSIRTRIPILLWLTTLQAGSPADRKIESIAEHTADTAQGAF